MPDDKVDVREVLRGVPWDELADVADELTEAGVDEDDVLREVAEVVDAVVPFNILIPGPIGALLEAKDDEAAHRILRVVWAKIKAIVAASRNPEMREARKERKRLKRERREREREERREKRKERREKRRTDKES